MGKPSDKDFEKIFNDPKVRERTYRTALREYAIGRIANPPPKPQKKAGGGMVSTKGNGKATRTKKCKMM